MVADFMKHDSITRTNYGSGKNGEEEDFEDTVDVEQFVRPTDELTGSTGILNRFQCKEPRHINENAGKDGKNNVASSSVKSEQLDGA